MPFLEGGVKGASTRNVRPRRSAGVLPRRQLRRRSTGGEPPERRRGEEVRVGSLEFCDRIELGCRRFDGVLVMVVDGSKCLLLQRGRASVVDQNRVERRRVPGRWNTAKDGDVRRARVIRHRDPRRQRDGDADGSRAPGRASCRLRRRRARRESRTRRRGPPYR